MRVDIGNALGETSPIGVSREALDALDERVAEAARRIDQGRTQEEFGYAALDLPEETDPGPNESAVDSIADVDTLLTIGIGGSSLGASTISRATKPTAGQGDLATPETHFLDNVDPAHTSQLLGALDLESTGLHVVSRSGTTAETLANFLVVREAYEESGVDWTTRTIVTTGGSGNLRDMAERHDLPVLTTPEGVPGRFSALSPVGLVPAAFQGADVEAILEGGRRASAALDESLFDAPAYAYGAMMYALDMRGANVNAMMPYAEALEPFAEWFAQLWAESLGKERLGQTPTRALGATDQHSQLQLYRAGPRDKVITLLRPTERPSVPIPESELEGLDYLEDASLDALLDAEFEATEASLAEAGLPNVRIEIDRVDESGIGELLYAMEAACILAGELYDVDTFTQPAVEWGKEAARGLLRGDRALPEKQELVIED